MPKTAGLYEHAVSEGRPQVLVVDSDESTRVGLDAFLSARGFSAIAFANAEDAMDRYSKERPAAVILEVVMAGGADGMAALAAFKKIDRDVPIIVLSGQSRASTVVETMRLGAADFITKPFETEDLEASLADVYRHYRLRRQAAPLPEGPESTPAMLFGRSDAMTEVRRAIERVAQLDAAVLICGERGTGKELVARAIHAASARHDGPFIKVNCTAVPGSLLESDLFGVEQGAVPGAFNARPGKLEFADHGTIFLDGIAEIGPALQAKLLPVLQKRAFSRLGGTNDVRVDVRIIASTCRELHAVLAEGQFGEDLLNGIVISVPPLRERREDIPVLTDYFFKKYSAQYRRPHSTISAETMRLFMEYDWLGNVRELENAIKRGVVLGSEAALRQHVSRATSAQRRAQPAADAGRSQLAPSAAPPESCSLKEISRSAARAAERVLILRMLQHTCWNRKEAAGILGISYKALLYKIKESGLDKPSSR